MLLALNASELAAVTSQSKLIWYVMMFIALMSVVAFFSRLKWLHVAVMFFTIFFGMMYIQWDMPLQVMSDIHQSDSVGTRLLTIYYYLTIGYYMMTFAVFINFIAFVCSEMSRMNKQLQAAEYQNEQAKHAAA